MKIYLAGNTPDREREEKILLQKNLTRKRLLAFHYLLCDKNVKLMFDLWTNENKLCRNSRN